MASDDFLAELRELVGSKRPRVGDDVARIPGPGGEWTVRHYPRRDRTSWWSLKISSPSSTGKARRHFCSVEAVRDALAAGAAAVGSAATDVSPDDLSGEDLAAFVDEVLVDPMAPASGLPPASPPELPSEAPESPPAPRRRPPEPARPASGPPHPPAEPPTRAERELLASLAIQQAWHFHRIRWAQATLRAATAGVRASFAARAEAIARHPHAAVPQHLHTRRVQTEAEVDELLLQPPLLHSPAEAAATATLSRSTRRYPRLCAQAYLANREVRLLGHLPTPRGVRRFECEYVVPNPAGRPSAAHAALLRHCFEDPWPAVLAAKLADPAMRAAAYDVYSAQHGGFCGSLAVQRLLMVIEGERVPVVVILSIGSQTRGVGYGTVMSMLARRLLFADLPASATHGYVVAECLPLSFWDGRMGCAPAHDRPAGSKQMVARAVGHVLAAHFPGHPALLDECTVRIARHWRTPSGQPIWH